MLYTHECISLALCGVKETAAGMQRKTEQVKRKKKAIFGLSCVSHFTFPVLPQPNRNRYNSLTCLLKSVLALANEPP